MGGRAIPMEDRMRRTTPRWIEDQAIAWDQVMTKSPKPGDRIAGALLLIASGIGLCAQKIHELKPQGTNAGRHNRTTHEKADR